MRVRARAALAAAVMTLGAGLAGTATAWDAGRTRTSAAIQANDAGARIVQFHFAAELLDGLPDLAGSDIVVGWGEVGGVEPEPFRVLIPAGCFVAKRLAWRVGDFGTCGVQVSYAAGIRGLVSLPIMDFDARVVRRLDGNHRLDIATSFYPPDPIDGDIPPDPVHSLLGAIGGAAVHLAIGDAMSTSPPLRADTVSGVDPTPF